jgi:hypothetical protein
MEITPGNATWQMVELNNVTITCTAASMALTGGTAVLGINAEGADRSITPGVATCHPQETTSITAEGASRAITAGGASISIGIPITCTAGVMALTPGGASWQEVSSSTAPSLRAAGTMVYRTTTGTLTPALPNGWQQGDLLIVLSNKNTTPSGYSALQSTELSQNLFYKIAGATESDPSLGSQLAGACAVVLVYQGVNQTTPFNVTPVSNTETSAGGSNTCTVNTTGVTTTVSNCLLVHVCKGSDDGWDNGESTGPNSGASWGSPGGAATTVNFAGSFFTAGNIMRSLAAYSGTRASAGATGTASATLSISSYSGDSLGSAIYGRCFALAPA